jgi:hypothetical protein
VQSVFKLNREVPLPPEIEGGDETPSKLAPVGSVGVSKVMFPVKPPDATAVIVNEVD